MIGILELKETESAHTEALVELRKMRETMEYMEQERAEMVAEVEAQIEKALASMAVDIDDSDEYDSRPGSRLSSRSGSRVSRPSSRTSRSRRTSDAGIRKQLRSFGTESTLVDSYDPAREDVQAKPDLSREEVIEEEEDDGAPQSPKVKRFSASGGEGQQDGMSAVDEGISERSDRIAQKVLQIQQKVESSPIHYSMKRLQALTSLLVGNFSWRMRWQQIAKDSGRPSPAQRVRVKERRGERSCPRPALALAKPQVWATGPPKARENAATPSRPSEPRLPVGIRSAQLVAVPPPSTPKRLGHQRAQKIIPRPSRKSQATSTLPLPHRRRPRPP